MGEKPTYRPADFHLLNALRHGTAVETPLTLSLTVRTPRSGEKIRTERTPQLSGHAIQLDPGVPPSSASHAAYENTGYPAVWNIVTPRSETSDEVAFPTSSTNLTPQSAPQYRVGCDSPEKRKCDEHSPPVASPPSAQWWLRSIAPLSSSHVELCHSTSPWPPGACTSDGKLPAKRQLTQSGPELTPRRYVFQ